MLIKSIKVKGIKNIAEELTIDFTKKNLKEAPNESIIKILYGPNGSGKTAIVELFNIYKNIVLNENALTNDIFNMYLEETINKKTNYLEMDIHFLIDKNKEYKHYLKIQKTNGISHKITEEKLKKVISKDELTFFSSSVGKSESLDVKNRKSISEMSEMLHNYSLNLLDKRSIVNIYYVKSQDEEFPEDKFNNSLNDILKFCQAIYIFNEAKDAHSNHFIDRILFNEIKSNEKSLKKSDDINTDDLEKMIFSNNRDIVREKDMEEYKKSIKRMEKFIKIFKPNLQEIKIDPVINDKIYYVDKIFIYDNVEIYYEFESTGIKKLTLLYHYLNSFDNRILVIDELDVHLHDVLLINLLNYINEYRSGQLICTMHTLSLKHEFKNKSNAISMLSLNNNIYNWSKTGNMSPTNAYKKGYIPNNAFGYDEIDFCEVFED